MTWVGLRKCLYLHLNFQLWQLIEFSNNLLFCWRSANLERDFLYLSSTAKLIFFFDKIEKLQFFAPFKSKRRQTKNWLTDKHVSSTFNENSFSRCTLQHRNAHRIKKSLNFPISGNQQKKTRIFDLAGLKYFQYGSEVETEKKTFFEISRESLDKY